MTVADAAFVPGVRIRIAGIEPPYSAPTYTLARSTMAVTGSMPYVSGSSSAIAIDGEMPGNAPPRIPQITPSSAPGIAQLPNSAWIACVSASMAYRRCHHDPPEAKRPAWDRT
jgi:hypothetical protein